MEQFTQWDWNNRACLEAFLVHFEADRGIEAVSQGLREQYLHAPTLNQVYGKIGLESFRQKLEDEFGEERVNTAYLRFRSRGQKRPQITLSRRPEILRLSRPLTPEEEADARYWRM